MTTLQKILAVALFLACGAFITSVIVLVDAGNTAWEAKQKTEYLCYGEVFYVDGEYLCKEKN